MGFRCDLKEIFSFMYEVKFSNNLTENEFDHVFIGYYNENPGINSREASDWKWVKLDDLKQDIALNPKNYTHWLKICLNRVITEVEDN